MNRKFRLTIQYLNEAELDFDMQFFTFAIEVDAYNIAFYLRYRFEDQIFNNATAALDANVHSYQNTPRNLICKLHLTKSLLAIFTFNAAKEFLR